MWTSQVVAAKAVLMQIRKPSKESDPPEDLVPCCWCGVGGGAYNLSCTSCQNIIPFCIATGKRMKITEWTECPKCCFPAWIGNLRSLVQATGKCPMCGGAVEEAQLILKSDPMVSYKGVNVQLES
jgi:WD repeat-containing protein 19